MTGIEVALPARAALGEGPTWDTATGELIWVDILGSEVHRYDPATGADTVLPTGQHVGAAKPCAGGGLVVNLRDGVGLYEADGSFGWLARTPLEGVRGNDAAVGPDGALWAGTMRYDEAPGGGELRRVGPDGTVSVLLDDVTVSNGIGWDPPGRLMYYVDTPTRRIDVFDFDAEHGATGRRAFTAVPGLPDGLTVDAGGFVWVAVWSGGRVLRYSPAGDLDRIIEVPTPQTTACAFGGPGLRDLYVTTARTGAPPDDPLAGALFVLQDAGLGIASAAFGQRTP
ncbi:SMP-30/gluconolactonase/LRE family protein [Actinomadura barringtoniae]|uniref:SMP-30/gluconolactonase/LRE family protein n=1 Tax=Actinomadura barringtoniae TaxID=1427535 RepID=A0A939PB07_9ACTN|nr:SMP-30/gluconolactonase/LRE family protein [Actinomadura barringtoniae]MBO2448862.1 SMP-30/gluconolactonase/LRE family protein [Actinomadura barringtoniae]